MVNKVTNKKNSCKKIQNNWSEKWFSMNDINKKYFWKILKKSDNNNGGEEISLLKSM